VKVLITGGKGMLGRSLAQRLEGEHETAVADLPECDLTDLARTRAFFADAAPDAVIHCAAMTDVDRCEAEEDLALRINAMGSAHVAIAAAECGAWLTAISTDYVFDGLAKRPYREWDPPGPSTAYGRSKLAGERAVERHCSRHTILRIAWLYGPGGPSFVHTMRRLGGERGEALRVVADQIGNPTSTLAVADLIARLLADPIPGVVHGSCEGDASWCDFAAEIMQAWDLPRAVAPCTTAEFPRPALRPANSRLEKRALRIAGRESTPHWREAFERFVAEHPDG